MEAAAMITMVLAGALTVAALIVTMVRIDLRKCLGYATPIDLTFTAMMLYMFHGTYSGIVAAASAGLFMSLALSLLVRVFGYERARVVRIHWTTLPEVEWIAYAPQAILQFSLASLLAKAKAALHP
jgi:hypothetical protein